MPRPIRIVALGCGLLGGVAASQGPEYAQQYRQRLGGAIDELRTVVARFETDARANGETRESAAARLRANTDDLVSRQGIAMQGNMDRLGHLERHRETMLQAGPFARIAALVREGDTDILRAAYRDFEPAVPVTEEGFLSAAAGFVAAWGGVLLLAGFLRSLWRRPRRAARPTPA